MRISKRIFRGMCGVSLLSVLLTCLCVTAVLYTTTFENMKNSIRRESGIIAASLNDGGFFLDQYRASSLRITIVNPDGSVYYDTAENPENMENHLDRPEVAGALRSGAAESQRLSSTLEAQIFYRAVRLDSGQVLRVSGTMSSVLSTVFSYIPLLLLAGVASVILSAAVARAQARRIASPLNDVDLDHPLSNDSYEEFAPLFRRMEQQRERIEEQMTELAHRQREFVSITDNMREGLIVLNGEALVLAINASARAALEADEDCLGRHILNLNRSGPFQRAVQEGLEGKQGETLLSLGGRDYRLTTSPVPGQGGFVLLLQDVTEALQAEQMRREFTANVSHELKTPLTAISGFAELIANGVAKPEDVASFGGRIYREAQRMIALIEDILRLSRLDEGRQDLCREPVNLLLLGEQVAARLEHQAKERGVTIRVEGSPVTVSGVPSLLEEMVANLCDNAIKYNRPDGRVDITVSEDGHGATLAIRDTGIGIPEEHRERVFERFYRVDKSHSKETGGTGLGLSIVKHGARYHGATVELRSEEGKGSEICIRFPSEG